MTYREMLERAQSMRSRDLFGKVTEEELNALPAAQTEKTVVCDDKTVVHIYELRPSGGPARACPMVINFHGGGFIKGRQDKDRVYCSGLSETFGALVWDVDYSLAPEHPFPAAVREAYAIVSYAFAHAAEIGTDAGRIVLAGHSAGGNLVAAVCQQLRNRAGFRPSCVLMEYFPADLHTDPAEKPRVAADMPAEVARTYNAFYCTPEAAVSPLASPLFAPAGSLRAFPDTMIVTAGLDSLHTEDEEFASQLAQAGVAVTLRQYPASHHGFTVNRTDEWEPALREQYDFIGRHISGKEKAEK